MNRVLINGIASKYLAVDDRGLNYGDGVFETIACVGTHPVFVDQHLKRMESGARKLKLVFPDRQLFLDDINCLLNNSTGHSVIKLILTRGSGKRGYRYDLKQAPTRLCMQSEWPEQVERWNENGINTRFCETPISLNPRLAGIKSLNRLDNVMASSELGTEYDEGFMTDIDGNVIEGTMSNLFAVINNVLVTPDVSCCGIDGIIREQVIDIAHQNGIRIEVRNINRDELMQSQEIFVSNSVIGLCVVKQLEQQFFNNNKVTTMINAKLQERMEADAKTAA